AGCHDRFLQGSRQWRNPPRNPESRRKQRPAKTRCQRAEHHPRQCSLRSAAQRDDDRHWRRLRPKALRASRPTAAKPPLTSVITTWFFKPALKDLLQQIGDAKEPAARGRNLCCVMSKAADQSLRQCAETRNSGGKS